jgi:hypothetical protein
MSYFSVEYSVGPRYIDGVNIDADVDASVNIKTTMLEASSSVTGLLGKGYEPGQKNKDGGEL